MSDVSYALKKIRPGFYSVAPQSCSADVSKHHSVALMLDGELRNSNMIFRRITAGNNKK